MFEVYSIQNHITYVDNVYRCVWHLWLTDVLTLILWTSKTYPYCVNTNTSVNSKWLHNALHNLYMYNVTYFSCIFKVFLQLSEGFLARFSGKNALVWFSFCCFFTPNFPIELLEMTVGTNERFLSENWKRRIYRRLSPTFCNLWNFVSTFERSLFYP